VSFTEAIIAQVLKPTFFVL